jgi:hypothetical protein
MDGLMRRLEWAIGWLVPPVFTILTMRLLLEAILRTGGPIGNDARIYYRASDAWLAGTDPWLAHTANEISGWTYHFAALPPMVVLGVPLTLLPEDVAVVLVMIGMASAGVLAVWRLGLPWYYLLFPPMVESVLSANPSNLVLVLLLVGTGWLASLIKVYAVVPMAGEGWWRGILVAGAVTLATVAIWPDLWAYYLTDFVDRQAQLTIEARGGYSAWGRPLLLVGTVIALLYLAVRDRRAAGWLAVPAAWPGSQLHWSTLALPVVTPWLALLLALPIRGLPAFAVMLYALSIALSRVRTRAGADDHATARLDAIDGPVESSS